MDYLVATTSVGCNVVTPIVAAVTVVSHVMSTSGKHSPYVGDHSVQSTVETSVASVAARITGGITAAGCWTYLNGNLLGNATRYSNADCVRDSFTNAFAFFDAFGFRYFAANRVWNFASLSFTNPFGFANRDFLRSCFTHVFCAAAVDLALLLFANPLGAAVIDNLLFLLANPFGAAVVDGFRAWFANGTADCVRTLNCVLLAAVFCATDLLGFTRWNPNLAAHSTAWCFATNLVARTGYPSATAGARIVCPATWDVNPFCVGSSWNGFSTGFPMPTADFDRARFGVRNATRASNGPRFLFFHLATYVIGHLFLLDFLDRATNRVINRPLFHFPDWATNGVINGFGVMLGDRTSYCVTTCFVGRFSNRSLYRVGFVAVAGLSNGSTDGYLNGFPNGLVAITVPCLLTGIVDDACARTHDCVAAASCVLCDCVSCSRIHGSGSCVACSATTRLRYAEAG